MQEYFTPLNLVVLGGIVGGLRTAAKSTDSIFLRITDVAIGIMAAISVSHYVPKDVPFMALFIGVIVGRSAGYAVDVVYNLVPQLIPLMIKILEFVQQNKDK